MKADLNKEKPIRIVSGLQKKQNFAEQVFDVVKDSVSAIGYLCLQLNMSKQKNLLKSLDNCEPPIVTAAVLDTNDYADCLFLIENIDAKFREEAIDGYQEKHLGTFLARVPLASLNKIEDSSLNLKRPSSSDLDKKNEFFPLDFYTFTDATILVECNAWALFDSNHDLLKIFSHVPNKCKVVRRSESDHFSGMAAIVGGAPCIDNENGALVQLLSQIYRIKKVAEEKIDYWVILGFLPSERDFYFLQYLGVNRDSVVLFGNPRLLSFEKIIVSTEVSIQDDYFKIRSLFNDGKELGRLFRSLSEETVSELPRKVMLIAKKAEVIESQFTLLIGKLCSELKFQILDPETLSDHDLAELFYHADCIVSSPCKELVGILFAKSNAIVVEITENETPLSVIGALSLANKLAYLRVLANDMKCSFTEPATTNNTDQVTLGVSHLVGEIVEELSRRIPPEENFPNKSFSNCKSTGVVDRRGLAEDWLKNEWAIYFDTSAKVVTVSGISAQCLPSDVCFIFELGFNSRIGGKSLFSGKDALFFGVIFALGMKARGNQTGQIIAVCDNQGIDVSDNTEFSLFLDCIERAGVGGMVTPYRMSIARVGEYIPKHSIDVLMLNDQFSISSFDDYLRFWSNKATSRGLLFGLGAIKDGRVFQALRAFCEEADAQYSIREENYSSLWEIDRVNSALVSVILPTLGRASLCIRSIESCLSSAEDPTAIEVLCYFDEGDESILEVRERFRDNQNIRFFVFPPVGYRYLNVYINELCRHARGRWLFLWNDDAEFKSKNWDSVLQRYGERMCLVSPFVENMPTYRGTIFPMIPRKWFEITGCFSNQTHNDTWVEEIAFQVDIFTREPRIAVFHERYSETGLNNDTTYQSRQYESEEFFSEPFKAQRRYQASLLKRYLEDIGDKRE